MLEYLFILTTILFVNCNIYIIPQLWIKYEEGNGTGLDTC